MYSYLYDEYCSLPSYQRSLAAIETRLNDLEIHGNICRMTPLKNLRDTIDLEHKKGSTTIVIVGDDSLVERVVNIVASHYPEIVVGIIPLGGNSHDIAQTLSIPMGLDACNILSYRMVRILRLGKINNRYFLASVVCEGNISIDCDQVFTVKTSDGGSSSIRITNNPYESVDHLHAAPPLRMVFESARRGPLRSTKESNFLNHRFTIHAQDRIKVRIDEHLVVAAPPITVESSTRKLRVITGALRPSIRSTLSTNQKLLEKKSPADPLWM